MGTTIWVVGSVTSLSHLSLYHWEGVTSPWLAPGSDPGSCLLNGSCGLTTRFCVSPINRTSSNILLMRWQNSHQNKYALSNWPDLTLLSSFFLGGVSRWTHTCRFRAWIGFLKVAQKTLKSGNGGFFPEGLCHYALFNYLYNLIKGTSWTSCHCKDALQF